MDYAGFAHWKRPGRIQPVRAWGGERSDFRLLYEVMEHRTLTEVGRRPRAKHVLHCGIDKLSLKGMEGQLSIIKVYDDKARMDIFGYKC